MLDTSKLNHIDTSKLNFYVNQLTGCYVLDDFIEGYFQIDFSNTIVITLHQYFAIISGFY